MLVSVLLYMELFCCCVDFLILEGDNLSAVFPTAGAAIAGHKLTAKQVSWAREVNKALLRVFCALIVNMCAWAGPFADVGCASPANKSPAAFTVSCDPKCSGAN